VTAPALTDVAYAEANHGRWVARCPYRWCTSAMALVRGQEFFECGGEGGCGATAPLAWPADPEAIEAFLLMRPAPTSRNWLVSETLEDLVAENIQNGDIPAEWLVLSESDPQLVIADITDQRVTGGLLYRQLEAAGLRHQIGA
jgi:hypothetical protein